MSSANIFPGLQPGANQSGFNVAVPYGPQQGGQATFGGGVNPMLPSSNGTGGNVPSYPQTAVSTNATSGFPALTGGYTPSSPTSTGVAAPANNPASGSTPITGTGASLGFPTTTQGQHQLYDQLSKTYGSGMATTLMNFLSSGAGYNSTAVNNLIAAMQPGFEMNQQNLLQQFAATGNRFSSGAQLGESSLMAQQQLNVGQLESQMYEQSVQDYLNLLTGTSNTDAQRISGTPSTGSGIGSILSSLLPAVAGPLASLFTGSSQ